MYEKPRTRSDFWYDILWTGIVIIFVALSTMIAWWFGFDINLWLGV